MNNPYWWESRGLHWTIHATNAKSKYVFVPAVWKINTFVFSDTFTDCTQSIKPDHHSQGRWSYSLQLVQKTGSNQLGPGRDRSHVSSFTVSAPSVSHKQIWNPSSSKSIFTELSKWCKLHLST